MMTQQLYAEEIKIVTIWWKRHLKTRDTSYLKAGPLRLKQLTNTLKIKILSQTSILYLIRHASVILNLVLQL